MAYLSIEEFKAHTLMPEEFVEDLDCTADGWIDRQLETWSRWIDSRLRKRYSVPFDETPSAPESVKEWLARIVTLRCYLKRGVDPNDLQMIEIKQDSDLAKAEILEAANSDEGWFDLPTLDSADPSAVSKGGPYGYSERSPYVWTDVEEDVGSSEDQSGTGTTL